MSDSFTEMVERYRKELALYGAQAAKVSPAAAIPMRAEPNAPPPEPEPPEESEPVPPAELEPTAPEEPASEVLPESAPMIPEPTEPEPEPEEPETALPQPEPVPEAPEPAVPRPPTEAPPETLAQPEPPAPEAEQNGMENAKLCHPDDTDSATLMVQVYTARQAIPVPDADVSVYCGDSSGKTLIAFRTTDEDGKSGPLRLAAPNRVFSETPTPPERPYAVYRVRIDHPEYISTTLEDVQLFGGIESILPVELTPYIPVDEPKPLRSVPLPAHSLSAGTEANET